MLSDAPLPPEQLRAAVQAVEAAGTMQQVRVRGVKAGDGPMRTTIELLEADPSAKVEVQVEQSEGRREVRVEVKKEAPGQAEAPAR